MIFLLLSSDSGFLSAFLLPACQLEKRYRALRGDRRPFDSHSAKLPALLVPAVTCCVWGTQQLCPPLRDEHPWLQWVTGGGGILTNELELGHCSKRENREEKRAAEEIPRFAFSV